MNAEQQIEAPRFNTATESGDVTEQSGYHQPDESFRTRERGPVRCGCSLTTPKGAYRDVTVKMPDGRTVHFYHQSPVVVTVGGRYRLSSCGWQTSTTKERINRYTPSGYKVVQRDYEWFLTTPDGDRVPFEDGMTIEV